MIKLFKLVGEITVDGLTKLEKDLKGLEGRAKKTVRPIVSLGRQAEKTGTFFTKTFTLPIVAAGAAITKFAADFEKSMATSTAIMGDLSESMREELTKTAKEISTKTTFSASELGKAYYYLASAGMSAEQSVKALGKVANFATAGQFDLSIATDLLTDAQSALGLSSKDAAKNEEGLARVSDVLVKANTLANASVQQFSEALTNRAGAALRILGKNVEEGTAVLAAYADQGVKGAEAGTQLGIVLRDLQKASIENRDEFVNNRISVYDAAGEMRNMGDIIYDLESALEGLSDEQKKTTLSTLGFQEKSVASLLTLIGTSSKIKEYEYNLRSAGGTTDEVAKKQLKNFNDQMKILYNRIQVAAINLGEKLLPVIQDTLVPILESGMQKLEGIVEWFRALPKPVQNGIVKILMLTAAIGPLLLVFGKLLVALRHLPILLGTAQKAIIAFKAIIVATNPALLILIGSIALLTAGVLKLQSAYAKVNKEIKDTNKFIKDQQIRNQEAFFAEMKARAELKKKKTEDVKEKKVEKKKPLYSKDEFEEIADFEQQKQDKINGLVAQNMEKREEIQKKNSNALRKYEEEMQQYNENQAERKIQLENKYIDDKIMKLEMERDSELKLAEELGVDKLAIEKYYAEQIQKIRDEDTQRNVSAQIQKLDTVNNYTQQALGIMSGFFNNQGIMIDNNYKKERKSIENSKVKEEEKKKALEALDAKYDKKKIALQKKQMLAEKASALFSIGINVSEAITKALAKTINPVFAGIIGALGLAQAAMVASKPLPELAEGGVIKKKTGGQMVLAAEAGEDEGFIPMKKGTASIAEAIIANMKRLPMAVAGSIQESAGQVASGVSGNMHVSAIYADNVSIAPTGALNLERGLRPIRTREDSRLGIS